MFIDVATPSRHAPQKNLKANQTYLYEAKYAATLTTTFKIEKNNNVFLRPYQSARNPKQNTPN